MRRTPVAAVLLLALASAPAAAGQDQDLTAMSLEDLLATPVDHIYGASKFLQKVTEAPASVTVISADDIRLYGYRTLGDALRSVEGISVSYDRNYTYVGLRGLSRPGDYNTRVLVLIDGHRMNNNVEDMAMLGSDFQLDLALVDRIEVIRGPAAALYGSSAFSAVVNVIMRRGQGLQGFEAAASMGSFDGRSARLSWGRRYSPDMEVMVSGSTQRTAGAAHLFFPEFAGPDTNDGIAVGADGEGVDRFALAASVRDIAVRAVYSSRTKDIPTASFGTLFNSGLEQTLDRRGFVDLQFTRSVGLSFELLARGYVDSYSYEGDYPYTGETDDEVVLNRDRSRGRWAGGEVAMSGRVARRHRLTFGGEYRYNAKQSTQNFDVDPWTLYIDTRPTSHTAALNLQDEFAVSPQVLLSVSGRQERLTNGHVGFSPKMGVILTPRTGTGIKLLFSRALRAPSAYELYYESPSNEGNAYLGPERMQSFEVNAEHYLTSRMVVEGSLYANTYNDLIVERASDDGIVALDNALDAKARGLELAWAFRGRRLRTRASYAMLFDADAASEAWSSGAPSHLAKWHVGGTLGRGVSAGLELQYESRRLTHLGETLPPAAVVNLNLTRARLFEGADLVVSLFNLLDEAYSEPVSENHRQGSIAQDGRRFLVGLTWRLR